MSGIYIATDNYGKRIALLYIVKIGAARYYYSITSDIYMMNVATFFSHRLPSVFLTTLTLSTLALTTVSTAQAASVAIYKDKRGQVLLTNVQPSGKFDRYNKKVRETYYRNDNARNTYTDNISNQIYGSSTTSHSSNRNAYDVYIRDSAQRHGVDPALLKAMMHTESSFNPNARSPVGAQGLMQLMPATARRFKVNNAWNPSENIEGSAKYLAWLMRRFNNRVEYAVAGYNAGEGNVDKYKGIPPFKETRNYVKSVMSRYNSLYKNDASLFGNGSMNASNVPAQSTNDGGAMRVSYGTSNNGNSSNRASYSNSAYAALR